MEGQDSRGGGRDRQDRGSTGREGGGGGTTGGSSADVQPAAGSVGVWAAEDALYLLG